MDKEKVLKRLTSEVKKVIKDKHFIFNDDNEAGKYNVSHIYHDLRFQYHITGDWLNISIDVMRTYDTDRLISRYESVSLKKEQAKELRDFLNAWLDQ